MRKQLEAIIKRIRLGETDKALKESYKIRSSFHFKRKIEMDTIAARFNSLQRDIHGNLINREDGQIELTKINTSLLTLLNKELNGDLEEEDYLKIILELGEKYNESKTIKNNPSRVREKNHITRKICQLLIEHPALTDQIKDSENQGLIAGIAYKTGIIPNIEDLDLLALIAQNSSGNYSKGNIVNALGGLVYSGQLRLGDDQNIKTILNNMKTNADAPLSKNIERVEIALDFLLG